MKILFVFERKGTAIFLFTQEKNAFFVLLRAFSGYFSHFSCSKRLFLEKK